MYSVYLRKSIIVVELKGEITKELIENIVNDFNKIIEDGNSSAKLLINVVYFDYWDSFSSLVDHLKFIKDYHKKLNKVAIITDSTVITGIEKFGKHFVDAQVQIFTNRDEAYIWVEN